MNSRSDNKNHNNCIMYLLYLFVFTAALNPLISFIFKTDRLHIITILFMLSILIISVLLNGKIKANKLFIPALVYVLVVLIGLIHNRVKINFAVQALSYRIMFPVLFLMLFSFQRAPANHGYQMIKIINYVSIILAIFGLLEKYNPNIIYKLYGNNLTSHLTLNFKDGLSSRLISLAANPINLGFYMAIGIGSAITIIFINFKKKKIIVVIETVFVLLFLYIMFYTYSRSAVLVAAVLILTLLILFMKNNNKSSFVLLFLAIAICILLATNIFKVESIRSRYGKLNLAVYFQNARFIRTREAFNKDISFFHLVFGHGIRELNRSNTYLFELGYASLLFESGVIGVIAVIASYLKGIISGIRDNKSEINDYKRYINAFYIAIIVSGLSGMLLGDLYMQQPFSLYLWFSTLFLVSDCKKHQMQL